MQTSTSSALTRPDAEAAVLPSRGQATVFSFPLRRARAAKRRSRPSRWDPSAFGLDLVSLVAAMVIVWPGAETPLLSVDFLVLLAFPVAGVLILAWRGLYRRRFGGRMPDELGAAVAGLSVAAMAIVGATVIGGGSLQEQSVGPLATLWLTSSALVCGGRTLLRASRRLDGGAVHRRHRALIVGAGQVGAEIARRLEEEPVAGLEPVGFLDDAPQCPGDVPVLGRLSDLEHVLAVHDIQHVVLAFSQTSDETLVPLVQRCSEMDVRVSVVPRLFELVGQRPRVDLVGMLPLVDLTRMDPRRAWQFRVKYALDRMVAGIALPLLLPLLVVLAVAVKLSSPGPVLFRQARVGRDGRVFDMLKFRSMSGTPGEVHTVAGPGLAPGGMEGEDRRTSIGRLMRRLGFDELPQLVNVLQGDMSLVGPRPERPRFVERFNGELSRYDDRHRVKAGLTGLSQVSGLRGRTSLADRVQADNFYIENWSLGLDFKILLMTLATPFVGPAE